MYKNLIVKSSAADTDIWLIDENGHPVQKAIGSLEARVRRGKYFVTFRLGSKQCCPISREEDVSYLQSDLENLGMCDIPTVLFPGDKNYVEYEIP